MNIKDFELIEETTIKEVVQYAKEYCMPLSPEGRCDHCKVKSLCQSIPSEHWELKPRKTYYDDFMEKYPKGNAGGIIACALYPELEDSCANQKNCDSCWKLPFPKEAKL